MILAETYAGLVTDPAHIFFELTLEAATGLLVYPLIRRARQRWADRLHRVLDAEHGVVHTETGVVGECEVWVK